MLTGKKKIKLLQEKLDLIKQENDELAAENHSLTKTVNKLKRRLRRIKEAAKNKEVVRIRVVSIYIIVVNDVFKRSI